MTFYGRKYFVERKTLVLAFTLFSSLIFVSVYLGPSCLVGIAILALLIPLNGVYVGNQTRKLQEAQMIQKDKRIRVMNEILSGIKVCIL